MTIVFSFDKQNGGFYIYKGYAFRICLWYFAITFIPGQFDEIIQEGLDEHRGLYQENDLQDR